MAVDEALLDGYADPACRHPPTLRLYGWDPPAVSLGRGQVAACSHDPLYLRRQRIDLVRRLTGGRAVLHEEERTYAVIGSLRREPFPGGVSDTYRRIAGTLVEALARLGIGAVATSPGRNVSPRSGAAACFAAAGAHEIEVAGRKVIGSAQVRRRAGFLQHGSILLAGDPRRLARALGESVAPRFTDIERILGRRVAVNEIDRALVDAFADRFGIELAPGRLTEDEQRRAALLRGFKHLSAEWTLHGRVGTRERLHGRL